MVVISVPGASVGADEFDADGVGAVTDGTITDGGAATPDGGPLAAAPNKFGAGGVWLSPDFAGPAGNAVGEAEACADGWGVALG
jgi:hypothetical protein